MNGMPPQARPPVYPVYAPARVAPHQVPQPYYGMQPPAAPVPPRERKCLHWLHALLTFCSCGLWGFGWLGVYLYTESANSAAQRRYQDQMREWYAYYHQAPR